MNTSVISVMGKDQIVKRVFTIGSSKAIVIDPLFLKKMDINETTFFEQKIVKGGLLLIPRKLT